MARVHKEEYMISQALFSSEIQNWSTPKELFDKLNHIFNFTLDPCADKDNATCPLYYTKEDNGLTKSWAGHKVFCNPPYGRTATNEWIKKCYDESRVPGTIVVALVPSRTDTQWFHDYIYNTNAQIFFIKGRLKFGSGENSAPFPSMLVIFGLHWLYLNKVPTLQKL